jgi:hypothetical protein
MKRSTQLVLFLVVWPLFAGFAVAQPTYPLSVNMSSQNWDNDMWTIKETTPERGFIVQVTVTNNHESLPLRIYSASFNFDLSYEEQHMALPYPNAIPNVLVPAKQSFIWYYAALFTNPQLGNWKLKASYTFTNLQWSDNKGMISLQSSQLSNNLEPYPVDFKVVSESQLQQDIQQYKQQRGTSINFNIEKINIVDMGGVSISIVAIGLVAYFLWRRKR